MQNPATPTEIASLLSEIGPIIVEQILETGTTVDEVAQALACVEAERIGEQHGPMSTRVAAVYAIIEDAFDDLDEDERAYPAVG